MREVAIVVAITVALVVGYMTFYVPEEDGVTGADGDVASQSGGGDGIGSAASGDGLSGPGSGISTAGGRQGRDDTTITDEERWAREDAAAAEIEARARDAEWARNWVPKSIEELQSDGQPLPGEQLN